MKVGKVNQIISDSNKQKIQSKIKREKLIENPGIFDNVDISSKAGKMSAGVIAKEAMLELKTSLLDTLQIDGIGSKNNDLYNLIDTPMDKFIKSRFSNLSTDTKKEFMNMFSSLSQISGGLVSENIINKTFGGSSKGFGEMTNQISQQLNKYI